MNKFNCFWYFKDYPKAFRWEGISSVFSLNTYLFFIIDTELLNSPQCRQIIQNKVYKY